MPRKARSPKSRSSPALSDPSEIVIEGDYPDLDRFPTGIYSMDQALGGGMPVRTPVEIFGFKYTGKSTLAYYLAGRTAAQLGGNIEILPFEALNKTYLASALALSGFKSEHGKVRLAPITTENRKGSRVPSDAETMLTRGRDSFRQEETAALVLDSVDVIVPTSELESDKIGEGQMMRRAKVMAEFMRSLTLYVRMKDRPSNAYLVNHSYAIVGGRGTTTSGGEAISNLCTVRIRLSRESDDDGVMIVKGTVEKLRYAPIKWENQQFRFVVKTGLGIHPGLTAVRDAIDAGAADEDRTIKIGAKSFGYFKTMIDNYNDPERFQPFIDALEELRDKNKTK